MACHGGAAKDAKVKANCAVACGRAGLPDYGVRAILRPVTATRLGNPQRAVCTRPLHTRTTNSDRIRRKKREAKPFTQWSRKPLWPPQRLTQAPEATAPSLSARPHRRLAPGIADAVLPMAPATTTTRLAATPRRALAVTMPQRVLLHAATSPDQPTT